MIVEGSVAQAGGRVRLTARLINGKTDERVWGQSYDRPARDILALQGEVAAAIARAINLVLTPGQQGQLARGKPVDPAACDLYLQGRHAWDLLTEAALRDAIRYFEQALALDPTFAQAYAGLADTYSVIGLGSYVAETVPTRAMMERAKALADRALALDDGLAEAHTSLGWIRYRYEWDWPAAERSFRRALSLNPGSAIARRWYALFLSDQGRAVEALTEARRAVELDPFSVTMHRALGLVHYNARRFDDAEAVTRRSLELTPKDSASQLILAWSLSGQGKFTAAIDLIERIPAAERGDEALATLGYAYARSAQPSRAGDIRRQLMARRPRPAPSSLVRVAVGLGDTDAAFLALDQAFEGRSGLIASLKVSPFLDPLRADPRFRDLLRRANLLPAQ